MTNPQIDQYGNKIWYNEKGQRHRENGPAVEYPNGSKEWLLNGKRHRQDGPAVEYVNGTKEWYLNGQLHREDGPAIEYADGTKVWYLNGQRLSFEKWQKQVIIKNIKSLL